MEQASPNRTSTVSPSFILTYKNVMSSGLFFKFLKVSVLKYCIWLSNVLKVGYPPSQNKFQQVKFQKINQNYDTDIVMYTYLFFEVCFVSLIKLSDVYLIL